jgi:hypothetical protein
MQPTTNSQNALAVLAQQKLGQLPAAFQSRAGSKLNEDMAGGITSGFAILSIRGKVWRVKHRGEERKLLNSDGTPIYSLPLVIIKASPHISKVWYEAGYVEGSNAPPDCWSVDGKKPDPASPKLQNPTCAGCRWNAWGSSRTQGGTGKGKDCADSKRFAVSFPHDIDGTPYGGPLLLRIPPASLADVLAYANSMETIGFPYYGVVTNVSFDVNAEYPKLMFSPARALTDEEAEKVLKWQGDPLTERILAAAVDEVHTDGVDTTHTVADQKLGPMQRPQTAPVAAPAPVQQPQAAAVQTTALPPAPTPQGNVVQLDPSADKRKQMKALGLTDEQIVAALGPEPKPTPAAPPPDPRIAQMKALGLTDEQINAALGIGQSLNTPAPAEAPKKRTRRSKEEMEAARAEDARKALEAQGQQTLPGTNGAHPPAQVAAPPPADAGEMPAFLARTNEAPQQPLRRNNPQPAIFPPTSRTCSMS